MDRARWLPHSSEAIFVLHHAPTVLVEMDDDETDTGLGQGIIAVEMITCQPFTVDIELENQGCSRTRCLTVRAAREQVPLTIAGASTLYTLQGTTATPGLIYHVRTLGCQVAVKAVKATNCFSGQGDNAANCHTALGC